MFANNDLTTSIRTITESFAKDLRGLLFEKAMEEVRLALAEVHPGNAPSAAVVPAKPAKVKSAKTAKTNGTVAINSAVVTNGAVAADGTAGANGAVAAKPANDTKAVDDDLVDVVTDHVESFVTKHPGCALKDVAATLNCDRPVIKEALRRLVMNHTLTSGRKDGVTVYRPVEEGSIASMAPMALAPEAVPSI